MLNLGDLVILTDTVWISTFREPHTHQIKEGSRGIVIRRTKEKKGFYYIAFGDKLAYVKGHFLKKFE